MSDGMSPVRCLPVCCLLGPTASGKTGLAVELVQQYKFEIISVDSALVFKRMDIGTAKPDADTLARAPHALIDLIEPWQSYSVARFIEDVRREIEVVHSKGRIPLLVGGTMLYFHALWNGLSKLPPADELLRRKLQAQAQSEGLESLHRRLTEVDPISAARINSTDPQRLLRAMEVYEATGIPLSQLQNQRDSVGQYSFYNIGLMPKDRTVLHLRIADRFKLMLSQGFVKEVETLMSDSRMSAEMPSMRCVGYRQIWAHLNGEYSSLEMSDKGIAATRQLAKRQMTWMRKMTHLNLLDITDNLENLINNESFLSWYGESSQGLSQQ